MNRPEIEFLIDGWASGESGRFRVIGCCGDFPIHLNDQFTAIYRYKPRRFPDELGDDPVREGELPASVRVVGIQAYGRSLNMLGQGMTGSLTVSGEGLDKITGGWALGMKNGHPADDHPNQPIHASRSGERD